MVIARNTGFRSLSSSFGQGHCVVFLDKTLNSHSASLHPRILMGTGEFNDGINPTIDWHPIQERRRGEVDILLDT